MISWYDSLTYLGVGLVAVLGCNAIGLTILILLKLVPTGSRYLRQFASITVGVSALVIGYSLVKSGGVTYNLGLLGLGVYLFFQLKKQFLNKIYRINDFFALEGIISYIIIFCITAALNTNSNYQIVIFKGDFLFYSQIVDSLNQNGFENKNRGINTICTECHGLIPYHYFELWFGALLSKLFSLISLQNLMLVIFLVLKSIALLGFISFFSFLTPVFWTIVCATFASFFFVSPIPYVIGDLVNIPFITNSFEGLLGPYNSVFFVLRLNASLLFFIASLLFFINGKLMPFFTTLLINTVNSF